MATSRNDAGAGPREQKTALYRDGVVETIWPVRITVADLRAAFAAVEKLGCGPIWLADCSATASFETACIALAGTLFIDLKKKGLRRVVAVLPSASLRMGARAASLASGVEIRVVERRLEAIPFLVPQK